LPESGPLRREAERLLVDWLLKGAGREGGSIEDLVAAHPRLGGHLRALHDSLAGFRSLILSEREAERLLGLVDSLPREAAPAGAAAAPAGPVGTARPDASPRYVEARVLAQGGMGTILRAWDRLLQREVALKVLTQPGPEGEAETRARFLAEAYVTARLDHPGIVPVHDLGADTDGQPFFVMKLVDGITLREALERLARGDEGWTQNRAVGVLARVAEAVAYAHSKRVLHRDIKPDNVMVGPFGETFLMDWGLARVLGRDGAPPAPDADDLTLLSSADIERVVGRACGATDSRPDGWLVTQDGKVLGTPAYMSPEQARGEVERVDERSDVWSLGALLHHLITGRVPRVRPGEQPLPLTVLLRARTERLAPARDLCPDAPPTLLRICERALSERPEERYRSADELAAALRDYLEDRSEAREEARRQAARATHLLEFLLGVLGSADPSRARGREVTVREVLDRAARRVRAQPTGSALDDAHVHQVLGRLYKELGRFAESVEHLRAAHAGFTGALGARHADALAAAADLALSLRRAGQAAEAESLLRTTHAAQARLLGARHPDTLRTLELLAALLHRVRGRLAEAGELYRQVLDGRREALGPDDVLTLETQGRLGLLLSDQGDLPGARGLLESAAHGLSLVHGDDHPATLIALSDVARLLWQSGQLEPAARTFLRVLGVQVRILSASHPDTLLTRNNLGMVLLDQGRLAEALAELQPAAEGCAAELGDRHPRTLDFRSNLARALLDAGRAAEAEALLRRVLADAGLADGVDETHAARYRTHLGRALLELGRAGEARAELSAARGVLARLLAPGHRFLREIEELMGRGQAGGVGGG
jgi:serine/threonine protein kinase